MWGPGWLLTPLLRKLLLKLTAPLGICSEFSDVQTHGICSNFGPSSRSFRLIGIADALVKVARLPEPPRAAIGFPKARGFQARGLEAEDELGLLASTWFGLR